MNETTTRLELWKMLGIFLGLTILCGMAIAGFEYALPSIKLPNSVRVAPTIVAAMLAGMFAAQRTMRLPTRREKFVFAVLATAASLLLVFVVFWALFAYDGVPFTIMTFTTALLGDLPNADILKILYAAVLFGIAASVLAIYFSLGFGAKTQLKALAREAAKGK